MQEIFVLMAIVPFAFFISFLLSNDRIADRINIVGSISLIGTGVILYSIYVLMGQPSGQVSLLSLKGIGQIYGFVFDPLSICFAFIIDIVAGCVLLYSTDYMSVNNNFHPITSGKVRFYAWMYLFVSSAILFVYSSNFIQLLINFELMSLACWGLISYYGDREAIRSANKMLIITHLGAYGGLAVAIGILLARYGNTELSVLASLPGPEKLIVTGLIMWAAITKSSQFPTYSWLPDAMKAPTPTSALLHGATMIEMGPYLVARVLYSMHSLPPSTTYIILIPSILSMIIASIMYPLLSDGKRILAYSTVAEVAFMYFAIAIMVYSVPLGLVLFILHFIVHAFLKSIGFLTMGSAGYYIGTYDLSRAMIPIGSNRFLMNMYLLSFLGLSGAPIYGISKIYILTKFAYAYGYSIIINPAFLLACLAMLVESLIILIIGVRWFNRGASSLSYQASTDTKMPIYMASSLSLLTIFLYIMQLCFFTVIKPAIGMM